MVAALLGAGPVGSGTVKGHTTAGPATAKLRPLATVSNMTVSPSTISFLATDPDLGVAPQAVTVTWTATAGVLFRPWTLTGMASSGTFTGCPTVPVSAVTMKCTSGSAPFLGSANCSGATQLSTAALQIAGGNEAILGGTYTVNLTLTLADSWKFIAKQVPQCTLNLTYTANLP
jgi:hypothetical protein